MNFKAFLLSAAVFAPVVLSASTPSNFDALVPKNEKASLEYKQTVTVVNGKLDSIKACGASSSDFKVFKSCVSKLDLPQLLVDNFPADKFKDAKAVELAMGAYSAALTKKHEENPEATSTDKTVKTDNSALSGVFLYASLAFWFLLYAGVALFFVVGFILIVYTYFVRNSETADL